MVGNDAEVEVEVRNFAGDGRPVLLGIRAARVRRHARPRRDPVRFRARGYAMMGNRIAIRVDLPMEMVEVHE